MCENYLYNQKIMFMLVSSYKYKALFNFEICISLSYVCL